MIYVAPRELISLGPSPSQGPFWPSCGGSDPACTGQGSPACFDRVITRPAPIANFGVLRPGYPGAVSYGLATVRVIWGLKGISPDPFYDYASPQINGGRTIVQIEIQRSELGTLQWPLDHYCPTPPASGICEYQRGCSPACTATCPACISNTNALAPRYVDRFYEDYAVATEKIYVYRIRFR